MVSGVNGRYERATCVRVCRSALLQGEVRSRRQDTGSRHFGGVRHGPSAIVACARYVFRSVSPGSGFGWQ